MRLNIDSSEVVQLTNKLEKLYRSALPVVVRQTLNDAAFLARREALKQFRKNFTVRKSGFVRSHIIVDRVKNTFSISEMVASTGIPKGKSKQGDDLKFLETGGRGRKHTSSSLLARKGKALKGLLNPAYYKSKNKKVLYRSGESTIIKTDTGLYRIFRGGRWKTLLKFNHIENNEADPFLAPAGQKAASSMVDLFKKRANARIKRGLR